MHIHKVTAKSTVFNLQVKSERHSIEHHLKEKKNTYRSIQSGSLKHYTDVCLPPLAYELYYILNIMSSSSKQDVEANTVRLKEHEQAVLVLEKSPRASTLGSIKYVCVLGAHIHT